jgi:hypothetical protein
LTVVLSSCCVDILHTTFFLKHYHSFLFFYLFFIFLFLSLHRAFDIDIPLVP